VKEVTAIGLIRDPKRVVQNMQKQGILVTSDGRIGFYPMTIRGIPDYSKPPQMLKDADAAVRQTGYVQEGVQSSLEKMQKMLDGLSILGRLLRAAKGDVDEKGIRDALDTLDLQVMPHAPGAKVRAPEMVAVKESLDKVRKDIEAGDFRKADASRGVVGANAEKRIETFKAHIEAWKERRKMCMEIRKMLAEHPEEAVQVLVSAQREAQGGFGMTRQDAAVELLRLAKMVAGEEEEGEDEGEEVTAADEAAEEVEEAEEVTAADKSEEDPGFSEELKSVRSQVQTKLSGKKSTKLGKLGFKGVLRETSTVGDLVSALTQVLAALE